MHTAENGRIYTEQLNIRLRPEEKKALEARAAERGRSLGDWSRETLLQSCEVAPEERRRLVILATGSEVNRLTIVAAQNAEDVSTDASRERIERQAQTAAESIVNRWLSLPSFRKGAL